MDFCKVAGELMLVLELDLVLLGSVLLELEWVSLGLSGLRGGEGEPSLSELSSTEFRLILKLIRPALVVFLRMKRFFRRVSSCAMLLVSVSVSVVTSDSSSMDSMTSRFLRSSLVALP